LRIRRYAELVRAGAGNERQRLEVLESHRAQVAAELATLTGHLELIDHKIDVYRRQLADGNASDLWSAPRRCGVSLQPWRNCYASDDPDADNPAATRLE
jgi:hypothetical protein